MARVKRGVTNHARHLKVIKAAKGYYGARKNLLTVANKAVEKASQYAYIEPCRSYQPQDCIFNFKFILNLLRR